MYTPKAFEESDQQNIFDFIQANSFGILFSQTETGPQATHLPLLLDTESEHEPVIWGHFAKANPHWRDIEGEVLVVFSGPHAYISPTWYDEANTVPTWNYLAVHAYGLFSLVREKAAMMKIVEATVNYYEASQPSAWKLDTDSHFNQKLIAGIIGFKIEITRLEGKRKLNQNHSIQRQQKVVEALQDSINDNEVAIARLMAKNLNGQ